MHHISFARPPPPALRLQAASAGAPGQGTSRDSNDGISAGDELMFGGRGDEKKGRDMSTRGRPMAFMGRSSR